MPCFSNKFYACLMKGHLIETSGPNDLTIKRIYASWNWIKLSISPERSGFKANLDKILDYDGTLITHGAIKS